MFIIRRKIRSAFIRLRRFVVSGRFGASPDTVYGDVFYDDGGFEKTQATAVSITAYLMRRYNPTSVLDVGCGMGNYLACFAEYGCAAVGVEGSSYGIARVPGTVLAIQHDLRTRLLMNKKFDLVMCVEVAEHVSRKYSEVLVDSICTHAKHMVLFTAAPPGTPGTDHINCQPREFWDKLFLKHGFTVDEQGTAELVKHAVASDTAVWFKKWAYIYSRQA